MYRCKKNALPHRERERAWCGQGLPCLCVAPQRVGFSACALTIVNCVVVHGCLQQSPYCQSPSSTAVVHIGHTRCTDTTTKRFFFFVFFFFLKFTHKHTQIIKSCSFSLNFIWSGTRYCTVMSAVAPPFWFGPISLEPWTTTFLQNKICNEKTKVWKVSGGRLSQNKSQQVQAASV